MDEKKTKMTRINFEDDIEIDHEALDIEWLEQPGKMLKYSRYSADTRQIMDMTKERLELVRAELDQQIRQYPDFYQIAKITEGSIQSTILKDPEYRKTAEEYINAKHEYELAQGAVKAFDQRKTALENLVRLHGASYFAGPSIPRNLSEERKARDQEVNKRIRMRRNKR
ncbi:MAG: hypothetical protein GWN01_09345 [Nitrosopumilaceae archaeon]|nr:hypothetical protein [Nitrosopumilaceae archaeon]NIU87814.1 hypothetical protein [Nitrosopumilaceae archaeon]NIV65196.1 hypothetical protein [Nitrosopumilaceae archaeon]NIX61712.1 hypothetical protein [Nitrosopumilaceae archaeon]